VVSLLRAGHGLYEIVADTFDDGSVSEREQSLKTVKTQRHRLRRRLVNPYEAPTRTSKSTCLDVREICQDH